MKNLRVFQCSPGEDRSETQKTVFWGWQILMLLLAAAGLTLVSLMLSVGPYPLYFCKAFFETPLIALLNFLPVLGLLLLCYALIGRPGWSFLVTALLVVGSSVGSYYKLFFRDDPVLFGDLMILKEAGKMAGNYSLFLDIYLLLALVCVIGGAAVLFLFARGRLRLRGRIAVLLASLAVLGAAVPLCLNDGIYYGRALNTAYLDSEWSSTQQYLAHGFIYPFLHSVKETVDTPPDGYRRAEAAELLAAYPDDGIPEDRRVNVIAVMLEAYNDFTGFGTPELAQDVYAVWHRLEAEGVSGNLITNIFAGGTIDTERCFLTGYTSLRSWRGAVNAYPWYFRSQGYRTEGMHACFDWFYNRRNINAYMGFENYYFVENYFADLTGGSVAYDDIFFPELLKTYQAAEADGTPYFSFNLNYQGHGPYKSDSFLWGAQGDYVVNDGRYTAEQHCILENYFGGIANTNAHLQELTDYLRTDDTPAVLVLFGDHNPWMGDGNSIYTAMGIQFDLGSEEGFRDYYTTRYIIWANDAAKAVLGRDFTGEGPDIGPYFLMNELFALCGWEGPAYLKAGSELMAQVPAVHSTGRYLENGALTDQLSPQGAAALERFRKIEYYHAHSPVG